MASNDWVLPVVTLGGLAIGGILLFPTIMKSMKKGYGDDEEGYFPMLEEYEEEPRLRIPLVGTRDIYGDGDDAYLITDEDFNKLDIGKKDKKWLNRQRKLKDARLERVLYGDNTFMPTMFAGMVNTVSPYGQGPAKEFTRLPGFSDQSRVNTRSNTVNLY